MRIQHNIMAMNAYRNYNNNTSALSKNLEKLSSGYKINRAGDDAAGLAISEKMRAQITGLGKAQDNAKDGISLVQTAEGALTEVHDMLNRMYELAEQSANGTYENETDRAQLQKEVDQLKSEINRIADSSNFNGIKLLDGSLGLNTDAFEMEAVSATTASDGTINVTKLFASKSETDTSKLHLGSVGVSAQTAPSFTIDLGNLQVDSSKNAGKIKIEFAGGQSIEISTVTTGGNAGVYSATAIGGAFVSALSGSGGYTGASGVNNDIKIGDFVFTVANNNSGLTFTAVGMDDGGTFKAFASGTEFTAEQAKAINGMVGSSVKVTTSDVTTTGNYYDYTTSVTTAQSKEGSKKAGIDFTLTADIVKDGNTLTIGNDTYTFKTDADSNLTGANVIDVSKYKTEKEQIEAAVEQLSQKAFDSALADGAGFEITAKNGNTLHFEQLVTDDKDLSKYDDIIKNLGISAKGEAVSAANAGTKITGSASSIDSGDILTVGDKQYVFTDDVNKTGKNSNGATYVQMGANGADAMKNLNDALKDDGFETKFDEDEGSVIVYAESATSGAPAVLGKGLTLQIGDTSDSYNQLSVTVKDIHTDMLGIEALSVADQDGAAAALDIIKNAINYVSDVRGTLGATQNRLDHTMNNLSVMEENIQDAESTIRDTDVADEMMAYTKNNILIQSAQAMLAQANQVPQGVLQLLQ